MPVRSTDVTLSRAAAHSLDQARKQVRTVFGGLDVEIEGRPGLKHAGMTRTTCEFGATVISVGACGGGWVRGGVRERIEFVFANSGGIVAKHPKFETTAGLGTVAGWAMPGQKYDLRTEVKTTVGVALFRPEALQTAGVALFGDGFELRDTYASQIPDPIGHVFVRTATTVMHELIELEKSGLASLVASSYEDALSSLALAMINPLSFANSQPHPNEVGRAIAYRAAEMIAARADGPVSVHALALELGVTARALQLSFRKHLGQTPMQFLMAQRMAIARGRLVNPRPRDNVQSIAMGCGFTNMSRFSSRYRALFGELPSETLANRRPR